MLMKGKTERVLFLSFIYLFLVSFMNEPKYTRTDYIEKFKYYAIMEMHRSGVPASITLAQGMLESGNGNSELSRIAKNHFGIKCHTEWKGQTFIMDDDEKNECFRVYKEVADSYADHSDFLVSRPRYSFLFDLDKEDYKGWAFGLKKAGYATNPKYPELLIQIIENHKLNDFDKITFEQLVEMKTYQPVNPGADKVFGGLKADKIMNFNDIKAILLIKNYSITELADKLNMMPWQLVKYNDTHIDSSFKKEQIVYLQPKKRKAKESTHKVEKYETLWEVSQLYGLRLKFLYKRNHLEEGEEVEEGEEINFNRKRDKKPKTRTLEDINKLKEQREIDKKLYLDSLVQVEKDRLKTIEIKKTNQLVTKSIDKNGNTKLDTLTITKPPIERPKAPEVDFHYVEKGETMYSISKKYYITVERLMELNNMKVPSISVGQKLKLKDE